jgi:hypothetical protein
MKVIRPLDMASSMLVSTSAVETDAEYNAATSYALNARCTMASTMRTYECIQGPSTGNTPSTSPLYWTDVGPSNKWAMFDAQVSTQTTATNTLTVTVATGLIDSVALVGVDCQLAQLVVRDGLGGPIIYDSTLPFTGDVPTDWYAYFFYDETSNRTIGIFENIPPYQTAHITVTLTSGVDVGLGGLLFGLSSHIGDAEYGASAGILDYSKKNTNATTGVTTFVQGAFRKRLSVNLVLNVAQVNRVQRLMYQLRATPCVWIASSDTRLEEAAIVYGFYRDFSATIAYPTRTLYALEIEGLV